MENFTSRYIYDMRSLIGSLQQGTAETSPAFSQMRYLGTNFKYGTATITWNREDAAKYASTFRSK